MKRIIRYMHYPCSFPCVAKTGCAFQNPTPLTPRRTPMSSSEQHKQIVTKLLDTKAIDFNTIGKEFGEVGASLALADFDGEDRFCGTMRNFIRVMILENPGIPVENLGELGVNRSEERRVGKECRSRWSLYH